MNPLFQYLYGEAVSQGIPWWAASPSPFTLIQWLTLTLLGYRLTGRFLHSFFTLGYIVLLSDAAWVVYSGLRFHTMHPESMLQLAFCFARDIALALLCYSYSSPRPTRNVYVLWLVNLLFMAAWFTLSTSPANTDWTYGLRYNYPWHTVLYTFMVSHIIGRIITGMIYYTQLVEA